MDTTPILGQLLVAIVTPMRSDGEVDWPSLERLVGECLDQGADGFVTTATKAIVGEAAPVIVGGASNATAHAVEFVQRAERAGGDGVLVVTPYYVKPTQAGLLAHFRAVADATRLPVMLYDIPGRTGKAISAETLVAASEHPNIVAVKDAKGDLAEVSYILGCTGLQYYSGDDAHILPELSIGAVGCVTVTGNIAPAAYRKLIDAVNVGDFATARVYHDHLEPLVSAAMTHVPGTVATKCILQGLGRIGTSRVRLPLVGPTASEFAQIEADISRVHDVPGVEFTDFRPDRAAATGGALL